MFLSDRDAKAALVLRRHLEAARITNDELVTGDEYGNEWQVVSVDDDGRVLTGQTIYVDGEDSAASVMDGLDPEWDA